MHATGTAPYSEYVPSRKRVIRLAHYTSPGVPRDGRRGAECCSGEMDVRTSGGRALCRGFIKYAVEADARCIRSISTGGGAHFSLYHLSVVIITDARRATRHAIHSFARVASGQLIFARSPEM